MWRKTVFCLMLLPFCVSCSSLSYQSSMAKIRPAYSAGDLNAALAVTAPKAAKSTTGLSDNALIWQLNHASVLRAAGQIEAADEEWEYAQNSFEKAWENERLHLARDTLGLAVPGVGDTAYYAKAHEGIMLYTYRILDALQMGNQDEAQRFILSAMMFRDEVIEENEARVEKRKKAIAQGAEAGAENDEAALTHVVLAEELEERERQHAVESMRDDSLAASGALLEKIEATRLENAQPGLDMDAYRDYMNPLTGFLTYLFLKTHGTGLRQTDRNNIERELQSFTVFAAKNKTIRAELKRKATDPLPDSVFVIFETGLAPYQTEVRVDVPIPSRHISHLGFAWPQLVYNSQFIPSLKVKDAGGQAIETELLVDMDAIVTREFEDIFPSVMARQIAQSVANAAVNVALNLAAEAAAAKIDNEGGRALMRLGTWMATMGLSSAMIEADIRSWELLPKQFQLTRLDIPADRCLELSFPTQSWEKKVTVVEGNVIVLLVKSTGPSQSEPLILQFKLL